MKRLVCLLFFVSISVSCSSTDLSIMESAQKPAHHTDDGFRNLYIEQIDKGPFTFVAMKYFGDEPFSDQAAEAHKVPIAEPDIEGLSRPADSPQITWLGHSTFLIQYRGVNILTDPILSNRASPVSFAGPQRMVAMPIAHGDLPPIDYVVISHNHYDHLDAESVAMFGDDPLYLVPLKIKDWFLSEGISADRVIEFDWWDEWASPDKPVKITATPSQHWSARGMFDRYATLWAAWHLQVDDFSLWFGGDTGYNEVQFKEVGDRWPNIDVGLIPIGAYAPRWFMKPQHVDPEEAIQIHKDIGANKSIGMHWGTFQLSAEPVMEPAERIVQAVEDGLVGQGEFFTMDVGETYRHKQGAQVVNITPNERLP